MRVGIGVVVQQDQHAVGVAEVPLVLLDPRAGQRPAELGEQRPAEQLRHRRGTTTSGKSACSSSTRLPWPSRRRRCPGRRRACRRRRARPRGSSCRLRRPLSSMMTQVLGREVGLEVGVGAARDRRRSRGRRRRAGAGRAGWLSTMNSTSKPGSRISSSIRMTSSSWQTARHLMVVPTADYTPAAPRVRSEDPPVHGTMTRFHAFGVRPLHSRLRLSSSRGDQARAIGELVEGLERGDRAPGAARRHRVGQDVHDGADHRAREPPDAGDGPQQDAGGAALPGVPALLPRQRRRVLRQLLRLLPAGGLRAGDRLVHREGSDDQRRDRPDAAVGDAVALRAPRRHHRRQRVVHLRPRLARGVLRDDAAARARAARSRATRSCASWSRSSTSATTTTSAAARSASAATSSRCIPSYEEHRRCGSSCSATRSTS